MNNNKSGKGRKGGPTDYANSSAKKQPTKRLKTSSRMVIQTKKEYIDDDDGDMRDYDSESETSEFQTKINQSSNPLKFVNFFRRQ
jgi:hypothetical protein